MAEEVIDKIINCLDNKQNFLVSGGAGSGKTHTLIETLNHIYKNDLKAKVACITFTNVAVNEIRERSPFSKLHVSTIHDFLWNEIKHYQKNLKSMLIRLVKGFHLAYNDDVSLLESLTQVKHKSFRALGQGIITHDDLLIVANVNDTI